MCGNAADMLWDELFSGEYTLTTTFWLAKGIFYFAEVFKGMTVAKTELAFDAHITIRQHKCGYGNQFAEISHFGPSVGLVKMSCAF